MKYVKTQEESNKFGEIDESYMTEELSLIMRLLGVMNISGDPKVRSTYIYASALCI